jgi:hypothetical protein
LRLSVGDGRGADEGDGVGVHAALVVASEALGAVVAASEYEVTEDCERGFDSSARCGSDIDGMGPPSPGGGAGIAAALTSAEGIALGRQVFSGVSGAMSAPTRPAGANFSPAAALRLGVTCARGAESGGGNA